MRDSEHHVLSYAQKPPPIGERCRDYDEDCDDVPCKLTCWLHDPTQGVCPYLAGQVRRFEG